MRKSFHKKKFEDCLDPMPRPHNKEPSFTTEGWKPIRRIKQRESGLKPVSRLMDKSTRALFRRRGFGAFGHEILTHWSEIAGPSLAEHARPERLNPAGKKDDGVILHLRVDIGWGPQVQHLEPVILERINRYYGYRAVTGLRIRQGHLSHPQKSRNFQPRNLSPKEKKEIANTVHGIKHEDLKTALQSLGESILAREGAKGTRKKN